MDWSISPLLGKACLSRFAARFCLKRSGMRDLKSPMRMNSALKVQEKLFRREEVG